MLIVPMILVQSEIALGIMAARYVAIEQLTLLLEIFHVPVEKGKKEQMLLMN